MIILPKATSITANSPAFLLQSLKYDDYDKSTQQKLSLINLNDKDSHAMTTLVEAG
jgi:hypothetical protein